MFLWRQPDAAAIAHLFATQVGFNYEAGAATIQQPPAGFFRNETVVKIEAPWASAVAAMSTWRMGQLGWCDFLTPGAPAVGQVVIARARHFGFWSLHPSRIIEVVRTEQIFCFTIRTLKGHSECGEEQFSLERLTTGEVRFAIRSYSRPAVLAGWVALPYVRRLQRRFGRQAAQVMQRL